MSAAKMHQKKKKPYLTLLAITTESVPLFIHVYILLSAIFC